MIMISRLALVFLLFSCASCALKSRGEQQKLREFYKQKQYQEALSFLEKSSLKKKKVNQLLFLMEKGKLLYRMEKYVEASNIFIEANELVDRLYTKSIRETLASGLLSDNSKSYYGSIFERSMLYYYQAMSYLKLSEISQNNKDRKSFLYKSRASLLAWDSFFQEINRKKDLKTLYRGSLVGKVLAASVHERIGGNSDNAIALQLYKDAHKILQKQGLTYRTFNEDYLAFIKVIKEKKSKKSKSKVSKKTTEFSLLNDFLVFKILNLTKRLRSYEFKKIARRYKAKKDIINKAKKKFNLSIILESGLVSPMKAKMQTYTIASAINSIENSTTRALVKAIGVPVLTYFAMGPLGLGVPARSGNYVYLSSHDLGTTLTKEAGIEFEMPAVELPKLKTEKVLLEVYSEDGKTKVLERDLILFGAINDVAFLQSNERASNSYKKVGTRVALKHLVAIITAYQTYKQVKKEGGELFAKPAAFAQYVLTAKAIAASEKADVRHWTTLPEGVRTVDLSLKPGKYLFKVKNVKAGDKKSALRNLGLVEITSADRQVLTFSLN